MGLINPRRNENGYRDFSDEDVKSINRIKTLRMLDVPIPEIKNYLMEMFSQKSSMKILINALF